MKIRTYYCGHKFKRSSRMPKPRGKANKFLARFMKDCIVKAYTTVINNHLHDLIYGTGKNKPMGIMNAKELEVDDPYPKKEGIRARSIYGKPPPPQLRITP